MDGQNVTHYTFKKGERIIQMGAKVQIGKENFLLNQIHSFIQIQLEMKLKELAEVCFA